MYKFYKFRPFVDINKLDFAQLCTNIHPFIIHYIEEHLDKYIDNYEVWFNLSSNPSTIDILKKQKYTEYINWSSICLNTNPEIRDILMENLDKLDFNLLSQNSVFIDIIEDEVNKNGFKNIKPRLLCNNNNPKALELLLSNNNDRFDWYTISSNPAGIPFILNNLDKINYTGLSLNTHPIAIDICIKNIDKIDLFWFSRNHSSIKYLEKNLDKIDFDGLSGNIYGISILLDNKDKINWSVLSSNSEAIQLLEENPDKIFYPEFSANPSIVTYNYEEIKNHMMNTIYDELILKNKIKID